MATPEQVAAIIEGLGDYEALLLEPRHYFDPFIVGVGQRGHDVFVLYDKAALIAKMAEEMAEEDADDDYDPETAAIEHFEFNMNQAGDGKPVFVQLIEPELSMAAPAFQIQGIVEESHLEGDVTVIDRVKLMSVSQVPADGD